MHAKVNLCFIHLSRVILIGMRKTQRMSTISICFERRIKLQKLTNWNV